MKKYEEPTIDIIKFSLSDILTKSSDFFVPDENGYINNNDQYDNVLLFF